jgi:hypothetical protein
VCTAILKQFFLSFPTAKLVNGAETFFLVLIYRLVVALFLFRFDVFCGSLGKTRKQHYNRKTFFLSESWKNCTKVHGTKLESSNKKIMVNLEKYGKIMAI